MKRIISILLTCLFILSTCPLYAMGWGQPAHEGINESAFTKFMSRYKNTQKYKDGRINLNASYKGAAVSGSSATESNHTEVVDPGKTVLGWVIHGGFSADEPHGYSGVKHFYDPLALSGSHKLTDQESSHGLVYTAIDAVTWATGHQENPFNFRRGLEYYKKSMEIPEDDSWSATSIPGLNFRDISIPCGTAAEGRNAYLGKSFRALGETMHLVADMTQPAHVRNDSHPIWESIEQNVSWVTAMYYASSPLDSRVSLAGSLSETMINLATFTNANFYTQDTIYDKAAEVNPRNGEKPNPHPQFADLTPFTEKSGQKGFKGKFNGKEVPLVRQTYMSYKTGLYTSYEVPAAYAVGIAEVSIPIAVAANIKVINSFFPTMKLTTLVKEDEEYPDNEPYRQFQMDAQLAHLVESDLEWKAAGLQIYYSGPAELLRIRDGEVFKMANLTFSGGYLDEVQDPFSEEMVPGPLLLSLRKDEDNPPVEMDLMATYMVDYEDTVFIRVNAGGRTFDSNKYTFQKDPAEITLVPDEYQAQPKAKVKITAEVKNAPKKPVYRWSFGDDTDEMETNKPEVEHIYEEEDDYDITVTLIDGKNDKELADAQGTAEIKILDLEGTWDLTLNIEGSKAQELIGGMTEKLLVKIFGEGADEAVEYTSLKGESIFAQMYLAPSDQDPGVFTGSFALTGSTNSEAIDISGSAIYIECLSSDNNLHLESEPVEGATYSFDGLMQNDNYLTGTFRFGDRTTEVIHGNWEAKRL